MRADTCRNEMDWEVPGAGGSSLHSSVDLGDREGMSMGDEGLAVTEYEPSGVECKGVSWNDLYDSKLRAPDPDRCTRERCCSCHSRSSVSNLCCSARAAACLRCRTGRHC